MADTLALGASAVRHGGSSPLPCTNKSAKADFLIHREASKSLCLREDLKTFDNFLQANAK